MRAVVMDSLPDSSKPAGQGRRGALDPGARALAFVLFAVVMLVAYRASLERRTYVDYYGIVSRTIPAANAGYPFHVYRGEDEPPERYTGPNDYGEAILMSARSVVGRALLGDGYMVNSRHMYQNLLAVFLVTALVFLLPGTPLVISLGGVAALCLAIVGGPMGFSTSRLWGVAYTALLVGMLAAVAYHPKKHAWQFVPVSALSLLVGFSTFLRGESIGIMLVTSAALAVSGLFIGGVAFFTTGDKKGAGRFVGSVLLVVVILQAGRFVVRQGVRGMYALAWHIPFGETVIVRHGAGHPLYTALGYIANPYNIAWSDPVGAIHGRLIDPEKKPFDSAYQEMMQQEWRRVVLESPWLLLKNAGVKLAYLHRLLDGQQAAYEPRFQFSNQPVYLAVLYKLGLAVLVLGFVAVVAYRRKPESLFVYVVFVGVVVGAFFTPLLVHPDYAAGPQGAILVVVLVMPAALAVSFGSEHDMWGHLPEEQRRRITTRSVVYGVALAVVAAAGALAAVQVRAVRYRAELDEVAHGDPLRQMGEMGTGYEHLFNDLSEEQKGQIVARLLESDDGRVAVVETGPEENSDVFRPVLAVLSKNQLHLIAWYGSYAGPEPQFQANVHTYVWLKYSGCGYKNVQAKYWINDRHWDGSTRMITYPLERGSVEPGLVDDIRLSFELQALEPLDESQRITYRSLTATQKARLEAADCALAVGD
jgi:hypothetical protein